MQIVSATISQLVIMFFFMGMGYFFKKKEIISDDASGTLSKLIVNIFLPAMVVRSFSDNFKLNVLTDKLMLLVFATVVLLITTVLAIFLAKLFSKNKDTQGIYIYSFAIPNLGYMGYPLVQAIFGDAALADVMVYCLPYNVFIYSVGMYLLSSNKKLSFKFLLNPSLVSVFIGMALGLLDIKLPEIVTKILKSAEACVSPCAMLLTGIVFARINMKAVFLDIRSYLASAIRLVIIPLIALFIFRKLNLPESWVLASVAILAMPLGVNSVVFPEAYGGDSESGAKVCFMAAVLAIVTIPVMFGLL